MAPKDSVQKRLMARRITDPLACVFIVGGTDIYRRIAANIDIYTVASLCQVSPGFKDYILSSKIVPRKADSYFQLVQWFEYNKYLDLAAELIEVSGQYGRTLIMAAEKDQPELVKTIMDLDAQKKSITDDQYSQALRWAGEKGHREIVELILKQIGQVERHLQRAAESGFEELVETIIDVARSMQVRLSRQAVNRARAELARVMADEGEDIFTFNPYGL